MNDRELLEAAARSAGYAPVRLTDDGTALLLEGVQQPWNPLESDGDALRLAVKLQLDIEFMNHCVFTQETSSAGRPSWGISESFNGDRYAATRRAIVRAAAALDGEKGEVR